MREQDFPNGAVVVFGGSGGLGSGVARAFAQAGSAVAIAYRSKHDVAEAIAAELREQGVDCTTHATDVADPERVNKALGDAVAAHGRIHTVVFGAGPVVEQVHLADTALELWQRSLAIETAGFINVVSAAIPHLREAGGGSFVHMGSAGHLWWPARDGLSVVPKAANEALVRGIAKEEGVNNIRANSVLIGVIDAGMFHTLSEQGAFPQSWVDETHKLLALKRWGQASEVGDAAVFLASRRAAYITGQQLNVSGGFGI